MTSITADLATMLSTVSRPGDFFTSGTIELPTPRLEVGSVGLIALPLLPHQAAQIVAVAERAPYGRGEETLVDTQVRRTWQIGAEQVRIGGKHWPQTLDAILKRVADGLGVTDPIEASLYKLLVYDEGSFFVSHRDTEKAQGMFATLVLALPSVSTGGELIVRHKGREASGNEGASFERSYSRAALVLWPRNPALEVLNQGGLSATLPSLDSLVDRWATAKEETGSALWRQAHELSGYMLSTWPHPVWHSPENESPTEVSRMLTLLTRLRDVERLGSFLADIASSGRIETGDTHAISEALAAFSPDHAVAALERLITGAAANSPDACAIVLCAAATLRPLEPAAFAGAGFVLIDRLPGDPARVPSNQPWRRAVQVRPQLVADVIVALAWIDAVLAARAVDHFLAWPQTYGLDPVLIPAMRRLIGRNEAPDAPSFRRLVSVCEAHLRSRVAEPLEAPRDWRRDHSVPCGCGHCAELSRFLADPERRSWALKAAEQARRHVEDIIRRARCDVDRITERRGRPYSLICTKNQASYERRVMQRRQDLEDLGSFVT